MMDVKVDQQYMMDLLVQRISELTVENAALKSALAVIQAEQNQEADGLPFEDEEG